MTTASPASSGAVRSELLRLLDLAWPVVVGQLAFVAMNLVGVGIAGQLGRDELAAVSVGNIWSFGLLILGMGTAIGLDPLFSQAHGAGDREGMNRSLGRSLLALGVVCLPLMIGHRLTAPALRLLRQPEELIPLAAAYCDALTWGVPGLLFFFVFRGYLQGQGVIRPAAAVMVLANGVNLLAGLGLAFGRFGLPNLGVEGAAWGVTLARCWMPLGLILFSAESRAGLRASVQYIDLAGAWRVLLLALPVGLQVAMEVEAFNLVGLMMGWVGADALAANVLLLSISSLSFMVPLGIGAAAATRVGNLIGGGARWGLTASLSLGLGILVMLGASGLLLSAGRTILSWGTDEPGVLQIALTLLPMAAMFQVFDGIQGVSFGILRGAGDLRVPMLANVVGYWCLGLPVGAWLAFGAGRGPQGVWMGLVLGLVVVASLLLLRVWQVHARGGTRLTVVVPAGSSG